MNTMKWLVKREFWEHKGGFFWTPAVVGSIIVLGTAATTVAGLVFKSRHGMNINGEQVTNLGRVVDAEDRAQIINALSQGYVMASAPLFMVMAVVIFFFCLGSLFDERKDRSVLFWKSLPVSDNETVLSKLAMALVAAPLVTLAFGLVTSLLVMLIAVAGAAASGLNLSGVFASAATYTAPFKVAAILPVYLPYQRAARDQHMVRTLDVIKDYSATPIGVAFQLHCRRILLSSHLLNARTNAKVDGGTTDGPCARSAGDGGKFRI